MGHKRELFEEPEGNNRIDPADVISPKERPTSLVSIISAALNERNEFYDQSEETRGRMPEYPIIQVPEKNYVIAVLDSDYDIGKLVVPLYEANSKGMPVLFVFSCPTSKESEIETKVLELQKSLTCFMTIGGPNTTGNFSYLLAQDFLLAGGGISQRLDSFTYIFQVGVLESDGAQIAKIGEARRQGHLHQQELINLNLAIEYFQSHNALLVNLKESEYHAH